MTFSSGDDVRDAVIPLSGWPGAITSYDVAADPVAGIEVTVRFHASNGVPEAMLRVSAAVREQLADERVTVFATSSLWGGEHEQLDKERLRAFVDQAIAHLGGRGPQPTSVTFAIAVEDAGRAKQERSLFRLEVALVLERAASTGEDGTPIPKAEAATFARPAVTAATL